MLPTSLITKTRFVGLAGGVVADIRELSENYAGKNLVLDNRVMTATNTTQHGAN